MIFQFTPLREGRQNCDRACSGVPNFNSRPSARGDCISASMCETAGSISIHAPPRGATGSSESGCRFHPFQFTPLREGRPTPGTSALRRRSISIHAPPRGATTNDWKRPWNQSIFQFTPLREGRLLIDAPVTAEAISIHAPPRGATGALYRSFFVFKFQFTPLREGRHGRIVRRVRAAAFQFTPLREGRRQKICNFCKSFVQPLQISMA